MTIYLFESFFVTLLISLSYILFLCMDVFSVECIDNDYELVNIYQFMLITDVKQQHNE